MGRLRAEVRGRRARVAQGHALAAAQALLDHHEVLVGGPEHHLAGEDAAPAQHVADVAALLLEHRVQRDVERLRGAPPPRSRPARSCPAAGAAPYSRDLDGHAEELGAPPLLLLLGQRAHQGDLAGELQVRVGLDADVRRFWFLSTLWMSVSRTLVSTTIFEMSGRISSGWLAQTWSPTWGLRCSEPKKTSL